MCDIRKDCFAKYFGWLRKVDSYFEERSIYKVRVYRYKDRFVSVQSNTTYNAKILVYTLNILSFFVYCPDDGQCDRNR